MDLATSSVALQNGLHEGNALALGLAAAFGPSTPGALAVLKIVFASGAGLAALVGWRTEKPALKNLMANSSLASVLLFLTLCLNDLCWILTWRRWAGQQKELVLAVLHQTSLKGRLIPAAGKLPGHLDAGEDAPDEVNVVIEIPRGSDVKYEMDEKSGFVFVDRFLYTATHYPFNYGFIPQTRSEDGDPLDALVITEDPVYPMSVIRSRPIGVLLMEDEGGPDAKLVAVPARHIDPTYSDVEHIMQIPEFTRKQIEHFFTHYKEAEPNKFVRIDRWEDQKFARALIKAALKRAQSQARKVR